MREPPRSASRKVKERCWVVTTPSLGSRVLDAAPEPPGQAGFQRQPTGTLASAREWGGKAAQPHSEKPRWWLGLPLGSAELCSAVLCAGVRVVGPRYPKSWCAAALALHCTSVFGGWFSACFSLLTTEFHLISAEHSPFTCVPFEEPFPWLPSTAVSAFTLLPPLVPRLHTQTPALVCV